MLAVADSTAERVGAVIRQLRASAGMKQEDLAERLGEAQAWVSRRELATTEATPSEIERIEQALGVELGSIYRLAGLVIGGDGSTRIAITEDPLLSQEAKRILLGAYDSVVAGLRRRGRQRPGDGVPEES